MTPGMAGLLARMRATEKTVPLLEAIRGIAEIALHHGSRRLGPAQAYTTAVRGLLAEFVQSLEPQDRAAIWPRRPGAPIALVVISSQRGLCGTFNARVVRAGIDRARSHQADGLITDLICLGERGRRLLVDAGRTVTYSSSLPSLTLPAYTEIERIALDLLDLAETHRYDRIEVIRHVPGERFGSTVVINQLWPPASVIPGSASSPLKVKPSSDAPSLIAHLLAEDLLMGLYEAVIESFMSEQQARVVAMRLARDNADRIVRELTRDYREARQHEVTSSLLEIISGYEAAEPTS